MAKRATKKAAAKKRAAKRELIAPHGDKRYIRRDARGRIKESDDVSRSLSLALAGSPQEGKEDRKARTGRSWRPEARVENHGAEKDACRALVKRLIFSETTPFRTDSDTRPIS
jgi:hypothetical protein